VFTGIQTVNPVQKGKTMTYVLTDHYPELKKDLDKAIEIAAKITKRNLPKFGSGDVYPAAHKDGKYTPIPNGDIRGHYWIEGFWTGQLWLCYEATGDEAFRELAEKNVDDFYNRVVENINIDWHHDTGFLYTPSCVAGYMLTGNQTAKKAAELAAYSLSRRFRAKGQFIQSMSAEFDEEFYRFIVDTMLNLPLLFWAAEEFGEESYRKKAIAHLNTTMKYAMREDGTTFHHVLMDNMTGEFKKGITWQGAGDNSCWSRGQAWVVYGLALAYAYTKDDSLIEPFCKVTDYFIEHLPKDNIPYWDFIFMDGDEPRDSSAAAVAVCGILEMAKHLPSDKNNMQRYIDSAVDMLKAMMSDTYAASYESGEEGLLLHSTSAKPQGEYDECLPYGDYYYLEALIRATRDWKSYW